MIEKRIDCIHFGPCPGCTYKACEIPPEIYNEAKDFFANRFQVKLEFKQGAVTSWRTRAKLAVRPKSSIGLFRKGTHEVLPIPHCKVHHPAINRVVKEVVLSFEQSGLSAYDEASHKGDLRYLQCVVERKTGRVQLTLVLNCKEISKEWRDFCHKLFAAGLYHSIWINKNWQKTNTITGREWEKIIGKEVIWEEIAGKEFAFGPSHFGQANLEMYEQLVLDMKYKILPARTLVELYAGIGIIGISLADQFQSIELSELESQAKTFFEHAYQKLPSQLQQKITFHTLSAAKSLDLIKGAEVCVVDPPRKGLGTEFTDKILAKESLKQLVYVACDFSSMQRDLEYIATTHPEWKVQEAISYLFFPGTNQIETVAYLTQVRE